MQMNLRLVIGIIAFCFTLSGVILANMFVIMMIGEINRKREDGKLISYFGSTPPNTMRIFEEYRRLYPKGKLHIYALGVFGLAMISLSVVAVLYLTYFDAR
jgi:hypothetical protein